MFGAMVRYSVDSDEVPYVLSKIVYPVSPEIKKYQIFINVGTL